MNYFMVGPMIYINDTRRTRRQAYPDIAGEIPGTRGWTLSRILNLTIKYTISKHSK